MCAGSLGEDFGLAGQELRSGPPIPGKTSIFQKIRMTVKIELDFPDSLAFFLHRLEVAP